MSLFRLEDVTFWRGDSRVLDGFSASFPAGTTCIVGPSGVGKSSLLRLLNRFADPDEGRVLFHGRDLRDLDVLALRRRVVLMQQEPVPLPGTVADNISYGPRLGHQKVDVSSLLARVALPGALAERDALELSVGQRQRVLIARSLAIEPEVLLLDEATAALDEEAKEAIEQTLVRLRGSVSLVVVTHDLGQVQRLADHVVDLGDGRAIGYSR